MCLLWQKYAQEEDWVFLLVDSKNVFNKENRMKMLWDIWYKCPSDAQFTFKCCHHWDTLVVRDTGISGHFFYSKEGMTQGDSLSIIAYIIGIFSITHKLHNTQPQVTQTWYSDDAGGGGHFANLCAQLKDLMASGSLRGYSPEPTNVILVVSAQNVLRAEA